MINWNEQLGKYHKTCKLYDCKANRFKQMASHDLLSELGDKYRNAKTVLNQSILKANNQKQNWVDTLD